MKRSLLMSALVLALAAPLAACGGGGTPDPANPGDAKPEEGGGDPVVQLQKISDDIQHDVDAILAPLKDADSILDDISKLAGELKAAKSKADWKKVLAEVQKITGGTEANIDGLGLEGDLKVKVTERFGKLKNLVEAIKNVDQAAKDLGSKITDALPKIPAIGAKAMAKIQLTLSNPLAGGDAKKQAEADKAKIQGIIDGFKTKAAQWQSDITALPAKAKDIPKKFAALK